MKEIDDTDPPESESELTIEHLWNWCKATEKEMEAEIHELKNKIEALEGKNRSTKLRLANLETQRTPEMENDDPEWFS